MEWLFILLFLVVRKKHAIGFGRFESEEQRVLFVYNPWPGSHICVDGFLSGVQDSDFLFFDRTVEEFDLQILYQSRVVFSQRFRFTDECMWIRIPQTLAGSLASMP